MNFTGLWQAVNRIAISTFFAGAAYFLWLAAVLLTREYEDPFFRGFFWVAAPLVTACGFALGLAICDCVSSVQVKFL